MPVAETFTFEDENGISLSDVSKLDTMVTVVDAVNFLKDYDEAKYLQDVGESLGEDDERSVADLLVDQVDIDGKNRHLPREISEAKEFLRSQPRS